MANDEFTFLNMKMSWSPKGDLQFGVFKKRGQQLKNVGKESTHTTGTLCEITLGVHSRLAKLTSRKPSLCSERVGNVYPNHVNALHKAGLSPSIFPIMGEVWKCQDERTNIEKEKEPEVNKKNRNIYFYVA